MLLCTVTVTTNTVHSVQWFNGSTLLDENSSGLSFSSPYRLNNATWQAAMEVAVITVHSSGWYYCRTVIDDMTASGAIQLSVQDISG